MSASYLDTLALGQTDPWLILADDENVGFSGSERVVNGVLDVDNVEATIVTLTMSDNTNTTHVATTNNHGNHTGVELDGIGDLSGAEVDLDGVVDLDGRIGVSDTITLSAFYGVSNQSLIQRLIGAGDLRASIMRNQVWDSTLAHLYSLDLAEFVFCLGLFNTMHGEAALGIVDQAEVLAGLVNGDDIHEASRVGGISANFAIDLDQALHKDGSGLATVQGILEAVSDEDNQRQAVTGFLLWCQYLSTPSRSGLRRT